MSTETNESLKNLETIRPKIIATQVKKKLELIKVEPRELLEYANYFLNRLSTQNQAELFQTANTKGLKAFCEEIFSAIRIGALKGNYTKQNHTSIYGELTENNSAYKASDDAVTEFAENIIHRMLALQKISIRLDSKKLEVLKKNIISRLLIRSFLPSDKQARVEVADLMAEIMMAMFNKSPPFAQKCLEDPQEMGESIFCFYKIALDLLNNPNLPENKIERVYCVSGMTEWIWDRAEMDRLLPQMESDPTAGEMTLGQDRYAKESAKTKERFLKQDGLFAVFKNNLDSETIDKWINNGKERIHKKFWGMRWSDFLMSAFFAVAMAFVIVTSLATFTGGNLLVGLQFGLPCVVICLMAFSTWKFSRARSHEKREGMLITTFIFPAGIIGGFLYFSTPVMPLLGLQIIATIGLVSVILHLSYQFYKLPRPLSGEEKIIYLVTGLGLVISLTAICIFGLLPATVPLFPIAMKINFLLALLPVGILWLSKTIKIRLEAGIGEEKLLEERLGMKSFAESQEISRNDISRRSHSQTYSGVTDATRPQQAGSALMEKPRQLSPKEKEEKLRESLIQGNLPHSLEYSECLLEEKDNNGSSFSSTGDSPLTGPFPAEPPVLNSSTAVDSMFAAASLLSEPSTTKVLSPS